MGNRLSKIPHALVAGLVACLAAGPAHGQPVSPALALVIGSAAYTAMPALPACELSANLAAAALSRAGFHVTKSLNPSNAQMGAALAALGDAVDAAPGTRAVVYFCGYSSIYADRAFILPVDARLDRPADVMTQGIVARLLVAAALSAKSGAGLVLMDLAPSSNQPGLVPLGAMVRPADEAHGGIAEASMRMGGPVAGPLASALTDMLRTPPVELQQALAEFASRPDLVAAAVAVRAPTSPTVLVDGPAPPPAATLAAPPPTPPPAPPQPPPATPVPPPPSVTPPPAPALAEPNTADRRRIQLALKNLGLYRGQVTGRFGPDTIAAIRHFQADSGEEQTGRLTTSQVERLVR